MNAPARLTLWLIAALCAVVGAFTGIEALYMLAGNALIAVVVLLGVQQPTRPRVERYHYNPDQEDS